MLRRGWLTCSFLTVVLLAMSVGNAAAQSVASGIIAGVVRDASGAVLPGVTVEAASPALIEKTREVVTDSAGQYKIVDLRPGPYTVTFTLPGFSTVKREGIELPTGFTATVSPEMSVGALAETVTVSTATPVVDVQNVLQKQALSNDVRNALPLPSNSGAYVVLIPGATQASAANQDVGGTKNESAQQFTIHGSRSGGFQQLRDGMFFGTMVAAGNNMSGVNTTSLQEVTVLTAGGVTAEAETGGAQINVVPRDGGNSTSGSFLANFGSKRLQSKNIDAALRARGAATPGSLTTLHEVAGGIGGPIKRDRLWYFADSRRWASASYQPGQYFNKRQGTLFYEPDLSRPAYDENWFNSASIRLTWQASEKDKFTGMLTLERNCNCFFNIASGTRAPEATSDSLYWPNWRTQVTWRRPQTNRLLYEFGMTVVRGKNNAERLQEGGSYEDYSVLNSLTNFRYGAPGSGLTSQQAWGSYLFGQRNEHFNATYVTGSHAFKVGGQFRYGPRDLNYYVNHNISYTFRGTVPQSVTYYAGPLLQSLRQRTWAAFAQDQWTIRRLTLNYGVRYDYLNGWSPAQHLPAGRFVPARDFAAVKDAIVYHDLSPRVGGTYDLFGNGKTAIKASIAQYVTFLGNGGLIAATNPINLMVTTANRNWNDANGDYVPQETELGPLSDSRFGTLAKATSYADNVTHGWGNREFSWQGNVFVQQELAPGVALNVGYYRTWYGNFTVTDNLDLTPSDYTTYCITAPTDSRLQSDVSGKQICGLWDLNPNRFGQVTNKVELASKFGEQTEVYSGFDATVAIRLRNGGLIQGGMSTQRQSSDRCFVVDSPQELYQCHTEPAGATQIKFSGVMPLPWNFRASGTLQNLPPIPTNASFVATNAQIVPSLGRNLSGCPTQAGACTANAAAIELIPPGTYRREPRITQVDFRLTRRFEVGNVDVQPQFDLFNVFNANSILTMTTRYGAAWQNVSAVLAPRLVKLGV